MRRAAFIQPETWVKKRRRSRARRRKRWMPKGSRSILVIHSGMVYSLILLLRPLRLLSPGHASVAHLGVVRATNEVNVGSCEPSVGSARLRTSASFWSAGLLRSVDMKKATQEAVVFDVFVRWTGEEYRRLTLFERKIYPRLSSIIVIQWSFLIKAFFSASLYRSVFCIFVTN